MSKRTDIMMGIEKNRTALLRVVLCWLALAFCVRVTRCVLPKRLSALVQTHIFKVELSAGYLLIAARSLGFKLSADDQYFIELSTRHSMGIVDEFDGQSLTLTTIISRLKAVRYALRRLAQVGNLSAYITDAPCHWLKQNFAHGVLATCATKEIYQAKQPLVPP